MNTTDDTTVAEPSAVQAELTLQFRMLCMGRINAAHRLAEMLAPLLEGKAPAPSLVALPVVSALPVLATEQFAALSTSELGALETVAPSVLVSEPATVTGTASVTRAAKKAKAR